MTNNLILMGEEWAVILDRAMLDELGIDAGTPLDISIEGGGILIRPAVDDHRARVLASAGRMMDAHDETFRKLAQ